MKSKIKWIILGILLVIIVVLVLMFPKSRGNYEWEGTYINQHMDNESLMMDKLTITKVDDKLHFEYFYEIRSNDVVGKSSAEFDSDDTGEELICTARDKVIEDLSYVVQLRMQKDGDVKFRIASSDKSIEDEEFLILERQ